MYVYLHECMHQYIHMCVCVCACVYIYIYIYIFIFEKSRVRASPVIVFIELLLTIINFVVGRARVNSKDNCDANPPVKAAEFTKVLH